MSKSPPFGRFPRYRDHDDSPRGPDRSTSAYRLDDLPPSPSFASPSENLLRGTPTSPYASHPSSSRNDNKNSRASFANESSSRSRPQQPDEAPLFGGPPPPIARSILLPADSRHDGARKKSNASGAVRNGLSTIKSVIFDPVPSYAPSPVHTHDSVWRGLMRRENAIETELQHLLDMQALGLDQGRGLPPGASPGASNDRDSHGNSTPTGTSFYSSRSQMITSINPALRSTSSGGVLPVRQPPPPSQRPGLGAVRRGLAHSISALANLKTEEDGHVTQALAQRQTALARLNALTSRDEHLTRELAAVDGDEEEPVGMELRAVSQKKDEVDAQIREMERKLEALRAESSRLAEATETLNNKREAGLSGFKGALRQVEKEIRAVLAHPPVSPLDKGMFLTDSQAPPDGDKQTGFDGAKVLGMPPRQRTPEMIKGWWRGEISVLAAKQAAIRREKEALEAGAGMWAEITETVAAFEQNLRQEVRRVVADGGDPAAASRRQLPRMRKVAQSLENCVSVAEEKGWTLLICAIGAELEAFTQAEEALRASLGVADGDDGDDENKEEWSSAHGSGLLGGLRRDRSPREGPREVTPDHSDSQDSNAVPQDLLTTHDDDDKTEGYSPPSLARTDSENEVPPSLLTEPV